MQTSRERTKHKDETNHEVDGRGGQGRGFSELPQVRGHGREPLGALGTFSRVSVICGIDGRWTAATRATHNDQRIAECAKGTMATSHGRAMGEHNDDSSACPVQPAQFDRSGAKFARIHLQNCQAAQADQGSKTPTSESEYGEWTTLYNRLDIPAAHAFFQPRMQHEHEHMKFMGPEWSIDCKKKLVAKRLCCKILLAHCPGQLGLPSRAFLYPLW